MYTETYDYTYSGGKKGDTPTNATAKITVFFSKPSYQASPVMSGNQTTELAGSGFPSEIYQNGFEDYPQDESYFRPVSDDYVIWYMVKPWDDGTRNFETYLVSFDEAGAITQYIKRYEKAPNMVNDIQELIASDTIEDGMTLLYSDETVYYVDATQYMNRVQIYTSKQDYVDRVSQEASTSNRGVNVFVAKG